MKLKLLTGAIATSIALSGCVIAVDTGSSKRNQQSSSQSVVTSSSTLSASVAKDQVLPTPDVVEELANGLKVIIVKTDYPDVVSMNIPVSTGSRNEVEAGKTGFAHFFEHMMFKGTPNYPQAKYDEILKNAGVDNRAYTTDDYTNYYTTFSKEHLKTMLMLEADRFQNLVYSEAQFKTEALTVKGEYLKNTANPIRKLLEASRKIAFTEHTYQHTTMGFFEDIEAMPEQMEYAGTFFERFYKPQNVSIVITGDIDPQETLKWVKQYWGEWQKGHYLADIKQEPKQTAAKYQHVKFDGMPGHWIMQGFHGC
jgi:zinc protease